MPKVRVARFPVGGRRQKDGRVVAVVQRKSENSDKRLWGHLSKLNRDYFVKWDRQQAGALESSSKSPKGILHTVCRLFRFPWGAPRVQQGR